jgi:preprotein translocase subunit YajC
VDILTLFPIIILIGFMFVMTRSAKKKQQQAAEMRDSMQPGTGVRTIGGMYATVKEVNDETVLLDAGPSSSVRTAPMTSTTASCTASRPT